MERYPDSLFTVENIRSVKLGPVNYGPYSAHGDSISGTRRTGAPIDLYSYVVQYTMVYPWPETLDLMLGYPPRYYPLEEHLFSPGPHSMDPPRQRIFARSCW